MATKPIEAQKAQTTGAAQAAQNANNNANSATPKKPESVGEVIAKTLSEEDKKRQELEKHQQELEKCLKNIEHKKTLMDNLEKFHKTDKDLAAITELVQDEIDEKNFESKLYRVKLVRVDMYGERSDITSISQAQLVIEFVKNLRNKISEKVVELETELMK